MGHEADLRVATARRWFDAQLETDRPSWDDLELVARLGLQHTGAVLQLLLHDVDRLATAWASARTADGPVEKPAAAVPPVEAQRGPGSGPPVPGAGAGTKARMTTLLTWFADSTRAGDDLKGLTTDDLTRVVERAPTNLEELRPLGRAVRANGDAILRALGHSTTAGSRPSTRGSVASKAKTAEPPAPTRRAPTTTAPTSTEQPPHGVTRADGFVGFDYDADHGTPRHPVTFSAKGSGVLAMSWPPAAPGEVHVYRVVADPEVLPDMTPEGMGRTVCATFDSHAEDATAHDSPVLHIAVWVHSGRSEKEARAAQPRLHATGGCPSPVRGSEVRADEGRVLGQWIPVPGTSRVDVLRVPAVEADSVQWYEDRYALSPSSVTLSTFTDDTAHPGTEYEYRIFAVAQVSGQDQKAPWVSHRVRTSVVVTGVQDLRVEPSVTDPDRYDLRWTTPTSGTVEIYRQQVAPPAGLTEGMHRRDSMVFREHLTADTKLLGGQPHVVDGQALVAGVPWPVSWLRAYFTPVTVLDEQTIRVGRTQILVRSAQVRDVQLIERVDEQFLTFGWPDGIAAVRIYQTLRGAPLTEPATAEPLLELTQDEYVDYGGAHLPRTLPPDGCTVHLVGATYSNGQPVLSDPVGVDYDGLMRLRYRFVDVPTRSRRRNQQSAMLQTEVRSDRKASNLALRVVHHPDRFPVHANDGQVVARGVLDLVAETSQPVGEPWDASRPGWYRLFAETPPADAHRVAVLDPAIEMLHRSLP